MLQFSCQANHINLGWTSKQMLDMLCRICDASDEDGNYAV